MAINQKECLVCGGTPEKTKFGYRKPDKYEIWLGIKNVKRLWVRCVDCGFYWQLRNYPLSKFSKLYFDGYRDPRFRSETIKQAYDRVQFYRTTGESENEERYLWFAYQVDFEDARKVLDVGSGLGVWPKILKDAEFDVTCVDENIDSVNFISEELEMQCYYHLNDVRGYFDTVTLIHVLEHIEDLDGFLKQVRMRLRKGGHLFIEVPDNMEFNWLHKDHDDFNSCHQWFFGLQSLCKVLERNGFTPKESTVKCPGSKARILMLCT